MYAPRGKTLWPNTCTAARWQSMGSPTCAVAEEKLGSLMVQRSRVPAGTTVSCARMVGETSKEANPRKIGKRDVLRRMVFLPEGGSSRADTHKCVDWTRAGEIQKLPEPKDIQRAESTPMRKSKQERISKELATRSRLRAKRAARR